MKNNMTRLIREHRSEDAATGRLWREEAADLMAVWETAEARDRLAEWARRHYQDKALEGGAALVQQLYLAALGEVDWEALCREPIAEMERRIGKPKIVRAEFPFEHYKQHEIHGLTGEDIAKLLGFPGEFGDDDEMKVKNCWCFTVDTWPCAVWDYKGSHQRKLHSAWGEAEQLRKVFGLHLQAGGAA